MILLDTDICIEILRGNRSVIERYKTCDESVAISFMSVGELYYGAEKSNYKERNKSIIDELLLSIDVINSDIQILRKFGELKSNLSENKNILPDADILIAATALVRCKKLVTGNVKHFKRFDHLIIENWL